jgi:hypothetical protein
VKRIDWPGVAIFITMMITARTNSLYPSLVWAVTSACEFINKHQNENKP